MRPLPEPSTTTTTRSALRARAELRASLGHEPTLSAVAERAQLSISTVRIAYVREGLDTRAGQGAAACHKVEVARAQLAETLGRDPTQAEVRNLTGLSAGCVSKIYTKLGIQPRANGAHERLLDTCQMLLSELGREPTRAEIAQTMGVSQQRVSKLVLAARRKDETRPVLSPL